MITLPQTLQIQSQHDIYSDLVRDHYSVVKAEDFNLTSDMQQAWESLQRAYSDLPADEFLPDNARYRFRRYDRFWFDPTSNELRLMPHEDYFQNAEINTVTGGIVRRFAPLTAEIAENPFLHELIRFDFNTFPMSDAMRQGTWQVDVHLMRVIAQRDVAGQPTPEGVHRDGGVFVTVHIAEINNVEGGEVSIYDDNKQHLTSFTLTDVLDSYLFRDEVLWHGVKPIAPIVGDQGVRSILTFDYHYAPALARP